MKNNKKGCDKMNTKSRLMLGMIICGLASYARELPRQIITSPIELSEIFEEKTLQDTQRNMEKLNVRTNPMKENSRGGVEIEVKQVPEITLKNDGDGHVYVEDVKTVPVEVISAGSPSQMPEISNGTQELTESTYLSEDMIKDYYRKRLKMNTSVKNDVKRNPVIQDAQDIEAKGIRTVYFSRNTQLKNPQDIPAIYRYVTENSISRIILTGHSDPTGDRKKNAVLSVERAEEVKSRLASLGLSRSMIEIRAKGDKEVIDKNNLPRNRRVEVEYVK
jgi:ompA/motB domain protein